MKTFSFPSRVFLVLLFLLAFLVRLYKIDSEPLDWHAFRQADTISVTREYVKHGIDILVPRYHDLSNIQSGEDNLQGYRMVEFPLVNALTAILVKSLGLPLVATSRLVSVLFSLGTLAALYALVKKLSGEKTAFFTALLFAFLPYSVFYSRSLLPEPALLFFSTFSLYTFLLWLEKKQLLWYSGFFVSLALGLLIKPSMAFLFPVYAGLVLYHELPFKKLTVGFFVQKILYYSVVVGPAFLISGGLLIAWRRWIEQFPSGIPALDWLFNSNSIRLRPAWFRWLFWERFTKLISGYVGVIFLPFAVLLPTKDLWVYASWAFGILIYLVVIATGNVQHDYYQVLTLPIVCIALGRGSSWLFTLLQLRFNQKIASAALGVAILAVFFLAWQQVKGYYTINHPEYIVAGQAVDRLTPPDAKVIAPAFGDTQFLFQTNRTGWPIGYEIDKKIELGAQYYVTTSYDDEARALEAEYQVIEKNDTFILIDLQQKKTL